MAAHRSEIEFDRHETDPGGPDIPAPGSAGPAVESSSLSLSFSTTANRAGTRDADLGEEPELRNARARRTAWLLLIGLTGVFAASIFYRAPGGDYFTICMFKSLTGLPCPGCGLTHSFCALGKGNVIDALRYNALGPAFFLLAAMLWFRQILLLAGRADGAHRIDRVMDRARVPQLSLLLLIVYGVGRIAYILVFEPRVAAGGALLKAARQLFGS